MAKMQDMINQVNVALAKTSARKTTMDKLIASGGFIKAPSQERSVVMADGTWKKVSDLQPSETLKDYGGCAMLGTGQLVPIGSIRAGDLSDYETSVLTSLAKFHGYSLEEIEEKHAQFEDLTLKIMGKVQEAIESRLKRLVADGISVERIRIEQRPDGSTAIIVDSIPDSSFRITYADDRP